MTHARRTSRRRPRRGAAFVMAMIYVALMGTLATAVYYVAGTNAAASVESADRRQARALAESGLRWQQARFALPQLRPVSTVGTITPIDADALWPQVRDRLVADWKTMPGNPVVTWGPQFARTTGLTLPTGRFEIVVRRLGSYATDPNSGDYRHFLRVTSVGVARPGSPREARVSASMTFSLDKRINFAVVGKTRIQLGRNTMVEGPVAMGTAKKFSPYLILSDFTHFDETLAARVDDFHEFMLREHEGYANRLSVNHADDFAAATDEGFFDYDGDAYIDEFDLFLERFDADGDGAVSRHEFSGSDGGLLEPDLWSAIDKLGGPRFAGDTVRDGYGDDLIDGRDGYAKVAGTVSMIDSAASWQTWLDSNGGGSIRDLIRGPIAPPLPGQTAVAFGAKQSDMIDLNPANFEAAAEAFRSRSGTAAGPTLRTKRVVTRDSDGRELWVKNRGSNAGQIVWADPGSAAATGGTYYDYDAEFETSVVENATLAAADASRGVVASAPAALRAVEQTPFGSTSRQATYDRPVYRGMTFRNVTIPKGTNALFEDCTFEGVTFVDLDRDVIVGGKPRTDSGNGMTWSQQMKSGKFDKNVALTADASHGYERGNNLRFDGCTFEGPLVGPYMTAYTHFTNSWEFTGETRFDNTFDETATIVAPQTNIEMGSFERPGEAPSKLVGVVVAGNIDVRGVSEVDGSVIVVGDGAGNTTLGYFGASDSDTTPDALPETGGYGRMNVRYNPYRALPDGIALPVLIEPAAGTYTEEAGDAK